MICAIIFFRKFLGIKQETLLKTMDYKIKTVTKNQADTYNKLSIRLIGIEFDREDYKLKDIKKWFVNNFK